MNEEYDVETLIKKMKLLVDDINTYSRIGGRLIDEIGERLEKIKENLALDKGKDD